MSGLKIMQSLHDLLGTIKATKGVPPIEDPKLCDHCRPMVAKSDDMRAHRAEMLERHPDVSTFKCNECGSSDWVLA